MTQFFRVFKFSFLSQLKSKGFIVSTIIMCVVVAAAISIPTIISLFKGNDSSSGDTAPGVAAAPGEASDNGVILLIDKNGLLDISELQEVFPDYRWLPGEDNDLSVRIEEGEINSALIINDEMSAEYIYKSDINVFSNDIASAIEQFITDRHRYSLLLAYNVSDEDAGRFFQSPVLVKRNIGMQNLVGQTQSFVFIMLLYITILSSGTVVSTSVAQEKSSRAMEMLITTTRAETLMFGKVIGIGLTGILQMLAIIGTGAGFYFINHANIETIELLGAMLSVPARTLVFTIIFYILGFFFNAMLFAAIGSLISRVEDLSSANAPLTLFTVAGFIVAIYGQLYGFAGSGIYKFLSYFPFTSPYVMMARIGGETLLSTGEIVISLAVLLVSTVLAGLLSARIYRVGVLMYGKKPGLKDIIKAMKAS